MVVRCAPQRRVPSTLYSVTMLLLEAKHESSRLPGWNARWMQAAKWKIRTHSIRTAASPLQRLEDAPLVNAPAHAGKLLGHKRMSTGGVTPRPTSAPLFPTRVRNTLGQRDEAARRNGTWKFLSRLTEVSARRGLCACNEQPRSGCKCKRAELIEVVDEMGEIIEALFLHGLGNEQNAVCRPAARCRKSYDYGHYASLDTVSPLRVLG